MKLDFNLPLRDDEASSKNLPSCSNGKRLEQNQESTKRVNNISTSNTSLPLCTKICSQCYWPIHAVSSKPAAITSQRNSTDLILNQPETSAKQLLKEMQGLVTSKHKITRLGIYI